MFLNDFLKYMNCKEINVEGTLNVFASHPGSMFQLSSAAYGVSITTDFPLILNQAD